MRFRTILLAVMVALIAAVLGVTIGRVAFTIQTSARSAVAEDLRRSRDLFSSIRSYRESLHKSEVHVVAEEPRLKAVVATEDVSHETVLGVAFELKKALRSDLFLITDGDGRLVADVLEPTAQGFDLSPNPLIAGTLKDGERAGVWTSEGAVFEVTARRLEFGTTPVGVLVIGFKLDDRMVDSIRRQTASLIAVELDGKLVAVSELEDGGSIDRAALAAGLATVPTSTDPSAAPTEITVGDERYLALAAPLAGYSGTATIRFFVVRSLERAVAPARSVAGVVLRIGAVGLSVAILLAVLLARGLSRPIDELLGFIKEITAGRLDKRAEAKGPVEIRELADAMNRMVSELDESRRHMAAKERLEKEMEISSRIQTSILPRRVDVEGLEIAARMIPATEVGGDYYDVFIGRPGDDGCWIGIGDVAGHGLTSGLIMLMVQSVVSALGRANPNTPPRDIVRVLNMVLFENIRGRLGNDEHVTFSIMRYRRDGTITFAGAHEEIIVCRAATQKCELIATLGPWVGAMNDVGHAVTDEKLRLMDGDLMVLYTDGVTEARNAAGAQLGMDRLLDTIEANQNEPVERIRDKILDEVAAFSPQQDDDITLLVIRYIAPKERLA
ncbi:MAG: SpoIIE family protein phosphatase [Polyangiaceae bacterium]|nr:SpoIIE family protein phosphatase [Polyangiaceae bacterium]